MPPDVNELIPLKPGHKHLFWFSIWDRGNERFSGLSSYPALTTTGSSSYEVGSKILSFIESRMASFAEMHKIAEYMASGKWMSAEHPELLDDEEYIFETKHE